MDVYRIFSIPDGARTSMFIDEKHSTMLLEKGLIPVNVNTRKNVLLRTGEIKGYTHTVAITTTFELLKDAQMMVAVMKSNAVPILSVFVDYNHLHMLDPYAFVSTYGSQQVMPYKYTISVVGMMQRMMKTRFPDFVVLGAEEETIYQSLMADVYFRFYTSVLFPYTTLDMSDFKDPELQPEEEIDGRDPARKLMALVLPILQRWQSVLYIGAAPANYLIQYPLNEYKIVSYDKFQPAYVSSAKKGVKHYNRYFSMSEMHGIKDINAVIIDAEDVSSKDQTSEQRSVRHEEYMQWLIALQARGLKYYSVKWRPRPGDERSFEGMMIPANAVFYLQAYNGMDSYETRMEGEFPIENWRPFDMDQYLEAVRRYNVMRKASSIVNGDQFQRLMLRFGIHGNYLELAVGERNVLSTFSMSNVRNTLDEVRKFLRGKRWAMTYPMWETPAGTYGPATYMNDYTGTLTTKIDSTRIFNDYAIYDPRLFDGISSAKVRVTTLSEFLPYMVETFPGVDFATRGTYVLSNFSFPQQQLNQSPSATLAPYVKEYSGMLRGTSMVDTYALYKPRITEAPGLALPSKYYTYADESGLSKTAGHLLNLLFMGSYFVIPIERYLRSVMRQDSSVYTFGEDTSSTLFHSEKEMIDAYNVYASSMKSQGHEPKYSKRYIIANLWTTKLTRVNFSDESINVLRTKNDYMRIAMILGDMDYQNEPGTLNVRLEFVIDWMLFDILVNRQVTGLTDDLLHKIRKYTL